MKITNKYNLPEAFVKAVSWDDYVREDGVYHVTELVNPPRIVQLTRRHDDEIEADASDRIWLLLGSAVHYILEKGEGINELVEEKLEININGVKVVGKSDLLSGKTLWDYKITSVWTMIYNPRGRDEWIAQLNIYKHLYEHYGFEVAALKNLAILRDWSQGRSNTGGDYPPIPVKEVSTPIWKDPLSYIKERIALHEAAKDLSDDKLPPCTPNEMWEKPERYALMKTGNKKAVKLFDDRESACNARTLTSKADNYYIETRLGQRVRCEDYCPVWQWCDSGRVAHLIKNVWQ